MTADDRHPVIVEWADAPDEDLPEPAQPSVLLWSRRHRRVLGAAVLVLGVLLSARIVTAHHGSHHPQRALSPAPSPTAPLSFGPLGTFGPLPVDVGAGQPKFDRIFPLCPATITCVTTASVPPGVLAAVRAHVPGAALDSATTSLQVPAVRVYFRQVTATAGGLTVFVVVSRPDAPPPGGSRDSPHLPGNVQLSTPDGYSVQVQVTGAPARIPSVAALLALAADPRLRAPS